MAEANFHPLLHKVSGKSGNLVFRQVKGRTVIAQAARRAPQPPSPLQLAQRLRFRAAGEYAKKILADPCQHRAYAALAKERDRRVDKLVTSDYLTPPTVDAIEPGGYHGQPGDVIKVLATDDVEVVSVMVTLRSITDTLLEEGAATKIHGVWCYTATTTAPVGQKIKITATAKDRPDHEGTATMSYP